MPLDLNQLKQRAREYVEIEARVNVHSVEYVERFELLGREDVVLSVVTDDPEDPEWWVVGGDTPMNLYSKNIMRSADEAYSFHTGIMLRMTARQIEEEPDDIGYDAFISHASEDKNPLVHPLADLLTGLGFRVWYDEFELKVGDSLRESIDRGLVNSEYGIVVLSPSFFRKNWPQYELNGLMAREMEGRKVILPIWHGVQKSDVLNYSPTLADKVALSTETLSLDEIANELAGVFLS